MFEDELLKETKRLKSKHCGRKRNNKIRFKGWVICLSKNLDPEISEIMGNMVSQDIWYLEHVLPHKVWEFLKSIPITVKPQSMPNCKFACHRTFADKSRIFITNPKYWMSEDRVEAPATLLHELAHVWHSRVLGNNHEGILALYQDALQDERYLLGPNPQNQKYMMKNHREFFAMLTESWFWHSVNLPFNKAFMKGYDEKAVKLMEDSWRVDPKQDKTEL